MDRDNWEKDKPHRRDDDGPQPMTDGTLPERRRRVEAEREVFHRHVVAKEGRRRRAREEGDRTMRSGWGAFGVVGWSIALPTLLGVAAGLWLDARFGGGIRYTLSLLALGVVIGLVNVWKWMNVE